jgi:GT2 family glycosyltransferase
LSVAANSARSEPAAGADFAVVICTRNRQEHLRDTLVALDAQTVHDFPVYIVDQSDELHPELAERAAAADGLHIISDDRRGLSRARNLAVERIEHEWLIFLDDDCHPEPEWAQAMQEVLARSPDVGFVSGHVGELNLATGGVTAATVPVAEERRISGRWVRPSTIGYGVCMAIRRSAARKLGGWDERLGPGVADFPASDDVDFNYRFLRAGGVAMLTPGPRAHHDQWRSGEDLVALYRGYTAAWAGFSLKHLRSGDVVGGAWLWSFAVRDLVRMFASAGKHRSRLRFHVAVGMLRGWATGTRKALTRSWAKP